MKDKKIFLGTSVSVTLSLIGAIVLFVLPELFPQNSILKEAVAMITVVSAFYAFVSVILHRIAAENKKEHQLLIQSIMPLASELSPKKYYPATDIPNVEFNKLINDEVCKTKSFFFFASKATYHITRLLSILHKTKRNAVFTIVIPDLNENTVFEAIADNEIERKRIKDEAITDKQLLVRKAQEETFKSIYFIYKLKKSYQNIELYLHQEIPFICFELSDNLLSVFFLPMIKEGYYPPSMVYDRDSLYWETFTAYAQQILHRSKSYDGEEIVDYLKRAFLKQQLGESKSFEIYLSGLEHEFQELERSTQKV